MAEPTWADFQNKQSQLRANLQNKNNGGGATPRKGTPAWAMRAKYFYFDSTPRRVRLIPTSNVPGNEFFRYSARWATRINPTGGKEIRRELISNSHNGEFDVPDLAFWYALQKEDIKLLGQPRDAITVVELCDFHEYQKPSADGKKTYPDLRPCNGVDRYGKSNCRDCDNKLPKLFGRQKFTPLSPKSKEDLLSELENLRNRCANPMCNGELQVVQYCCADCKAVLLNLYDAAKAGEDVTGDIAYLEEAANPASKELIECECCTKGGEKLKDGVKVERQYECRVIRGTTAVPGCSTPTKLPDDLSIFDIDFVATAESYKIHITDFEPRRAYPAASPTMNVPMPLHTFLACQTLAEQAAALGISPQQFIAETGLTEAELAQKIQTFITQQG